MDKKQMKIGILGGTFNPVHMGHLLLAEWAKEAAELKQVIFIPTGNPYMKKGEIPDGKKRMKMIELAIRGQEAFTCSDIEIERKGATYTFETLEELKRRMPEGELYFIVGADCLFSIEKWKYPERIFQSCTLIAAVRESHPMQKLEEKSRQLKEAYDAKIKLLPFPAMEISSTQIRQRAEEGKSIRYLVPEAVQDYIEEQRLYYR